MTTPGVQAPHWVAPAERSYSVDPVANRTSISHLPHFLGYTRIDYVCTGHMRCTPRGSAQPLLRQLLSSLGS